MSGKMIERLSLKVKIEDEVTEFDSALIDQFTKDVDAFLASKKKPDKSLK